MQNLRRPTYLLNLVFAATLVVCLLWKPLPPPRFVGITAEQVPARAGEFTFQSETEVAPEVRAALAAGTLIERTYLSAEGVPLDFVLIGGTDRSALHDPRSCFAGADWRISADRPEPIPGTTVTARSCRIERPGTAYDVLYFYVVDGQVIHEVTRIRAHMLWSALIGRQGRPVYFLRFIQPAEAEHGRLLRFAESLWTALRPQLTAGR